MTARTRHRLIVLLLLALVTLPAEAVVLPALRTPTLNGAAAEWAAALSPEARRAAGDDIRSYPYDFRLALMALYSPEERQQTWIGNFQNYENEHPAIGPQQRYVIEHAIQFIRDNPDLFSGEPAAQDIRDRLNAIYSVSVAVLGQRTARELFYRLGPDKMSGAQVMPLRLRLANRVRQFLVVHASGTSSCECSQGGDADCNVGVEHTYYCSDVSDCQINADYPMCGPLWSYACVGLCHWNPPSGG
jgi:hypothetical protein